MYDVLMILPIIFTYFLIFVIYRFVSERKILQTAYIGAAIYTFLFEFAKWIVTIYLSFAFSSYQYFYQGYAVFIVIGIWVFIPLTFRCFCYINEAYKEIYETPNTSIEMNFAFLD